LGFKESLISWSARILKLFGEFQLNVSRRIRQQRVLAPLFLFPFAGASAKDATPKQNPFSLHSAQLLRLELA
jgi:hypothetical protein